MPDQTPFEARLTEMLEIDAGAGVRPFDRYAIARSVIDGGTRRRSAGPFTIPRWLRPVMVAILLTTLTAASMVVASRLLDRVPPAPLELTLTPTGSMAYARSGHAATLLADGRVLVTGGFNGGNGTGVGGIGRRNLTAELYDPATGAFSATGDPLEARLGHTSTLLRDGRVLIVGGLDNEASAEVYDPGSGRFTSVGTPDAGRTPHAAVTLLDGTVAIIGLVPGVDVFDPTTGTVRPGPTDRNLQRVKPSAVLLRDGRVLVAGGVDDVSSVTRALLKRAAIWDPAADAVVDLGLLPGSPGGVGGLVSLPDGRVLLFLLDNERRAWTVQVFDQDTQTFSFLAEIPGQPILDPAVLGDGRVLLVFDRDGDLGCQGLRAMVFDPAFGRTDPVGEIPGLGTCNGPSEATVTTLADGSALITGGNSPGGETVEVATIVGPANVTR